MWRKTFTTLLFLIVLSSCCIISGEATKGGRMLRTNHCPDPPADAEFVALKGDEKCEGVKIIDGKKCCCRCAGASNTDAAGYYCNPKYCAIQALKSTMSATGTMTPAAGVPATSIDVPTASFISTWHSIPNLL